MKRNHINGGPGIIVSAQETVAAASCMNRSCSPHGLVFKEFFLEGREEALALAAPAEMTPLTSGWLTVSSTCPGRSGGS